MSTVMRTMPEFQSTPPVKAATPPFSQGDKHLLFQSTPPVKAATREVAKFISRGGISIHAAREGGDAVAD